MTELERFWQWFESEKPSVAVAIEKAGERFSPFEQVVLFRAARIICSEKEKWTVFAADWCLEHQPVALRNLSLALAPAYEQLKKDLGL